MTIEINSLAKQYQGRKFGELVLHHCNKQTKSETAKAMFGTARNLRAEVEAYVENWIGHESPKGEAPEYWSKDCGAALIRICTDVEVYYRLFTIEQLNLNQEECFSLFNITVLNYAFAAHDDPSAKAFIQKSVGRGLIGRLFS